MLLPRYRLSLEIVYGLYQQIFEKIDPEKGTFAEDELNPDMAEVKERIELTVSAVSSSGK